MSTKGADVLIMKPADEWPGQSVTPLYGNLTNGYVTITAVMWEPLELVTCDTLYKV